MREKQTPPTSGEKPFVIRAEHLPYYSPLIHPGRDGEVHTPQRLAGIKRFNLQSPDFLDVLRNPKDIPKVKAYRKDVIGRTPKKARRFEQATEAVFTKFLELPDDGPVELVEGQKDEICNTCPIKGQHCPMNDRTAFGGENNTLNGEREMVDVFLNEAEKIKAPFSISHEIATFTDYPSTEVRRIRTDAATVKKVIINVESRANK